MSRTVRANILNLALRIDPRDASTNLEFTESTICQDGHDGHKFPIQRIVDIYNEARMTLFNFLKSKLSQDKMLIELNSLVQRANLLFTSSDRNYAVSLPAGCLKIIDLTGQMGSSPLTTQIRLIPVLPFNLWSLVEEGQYPYYAQSNNNKFVFEVDSQLIGIGSFLAPLAATGTISSNDTAVTGTSTLFTTQATVGDWITAAGQSKQIDTISSATALTTKTAFDPALSGATFSLSSYRLRYYGITNFTLSAVTGGTTTETFSDSLYPALLSIAEAIAAGLGEQEVLAVAEKFAGSEKSTR